MTGKTDELLPCPFGCNGDIGHINRNGGVCYVCVECGASGPFSDGDPEEPEVWVASRAAWNRRTQPAVKALVWQENSTYAKVEFGADTLYYSIDQVDEKLDAWSVTTRVIGSEFGETEVHRCIGKTNALAAANAVHERFVLSLIHTALVSAPADPATAPAWNGWRSIDTAPEDQHFILATSGGFVGEAIMLRDEDTGAQKWAWALGPVHENHRPYGWKPLPEPLFAPVLSDLRPDGFDGPTGAE